MPPLGGHVARAEPLVVRRLRRVVPLRAAHHQRRHVEAAVHPKRRAGADDADFVAVARAWACAAVCSPLPRVWVAKSIAVPV